MSHEVRWICEGEMPKLLQGGGENIVKVPFPLPTTFPPCPSVAPLFPFIPYFNSIDVIGCSTATQLVVVRKRGIKPEGAPHTNVLVLVRVSDLSSEGRAHVEDSGSATPSPHLSLGVSGTCPSRVSYTTNGEERIVSFTVPTCYRTIATPPPTVPRPLNA